MPDYYNSVITKYNTDTNGNIVPKLIQNENIKVLFNGIALLDEIPYKPYGVFINGYTETSSGTALSSTQFFVEYDGAGSGKVHFAISEVGKHLTVTYKGIGKECIIASRIATEYTEDGDIVQSLAEYINQYIDVMDANRIHRQVKKYTATSPITTIPYASITGLTWNPAFDNLQIIRDNLILIEDENYSVDDNGITLYEALDTGESIFVIVFRGLLEDVPAPSSDGSLLLPGSVGLSKLEQLTQDKINAVPVLQSDLSELTSKCANISIDIEEFGAIQDTDSTTAIQSAINSLDAIKGGVILIPPKTYLSGEIDVTGQNVVFLSFGGTIKLKDGANTSLLWVKTGADNFKILGQLNFDGNASGNPSQVQNITTPYITNSALVQIQSNKPIIENVIIQNTNLRGLLVGGYTDTSIMIEKPIIKNVKTYNTKGQGIYVPFSKQPLVDGSTVSLTGGASFIQVTDVNGTIISTATPFTHNVNTMIGCFLLESNGKYSFVGSITKSTNPDNTTLFSVNSLTLYGGTGNLTYSSNLYILSAPYEANGIEISNSTDAKIVESHTEYTTKVGMGVIQDRGSSAIVANCTTKYAGEEGQILDGCFGGKIIGGTSEGCSINSNAPDFHIANASPGISTPLENIITGCTSINGLGAVLINAGLNNGTIPDDTIISNNKIYRNSSYNWVSNTIGIESVGICSIMNNVIKGVMNGIIVTGGSDTPKVKGNILVGTDASTSIGIISNNCARTIIDENTIQHFDSAIKVDSQGGYKIDRNTIKYCNYALDTTLTDSDTSYIGNTTHSTNLFKNSIPYIVEDIVFDYYQSGISYPRTAYSSPVMFTINKSGYLRVMADGNFESPSEKIYRIFKYGQGSTPYLLSELSATEVNSSIISSSATINDSGVVTVSVTGSGGGQGVSYVFSMKPF